MKIDFHTHYRKESFDGICKKAKEIGLDAIVAEGFLLRESVECQGVLVFPAQEVDWNAILEINDYQTYEDLEKNNPHIKRINHSGKALVLLPSEIKRFDYDSDLFSLIEQVSYLGGVTISLYNEQNFSVTTALEKPGGREKIYRFDGIRIKPTLNDVYCGQFYSVPLVAGSNAFSAENLTSEKGFTKYKDSIKTQNELIRAIKQKHPTNLFVHGVSEPVPFEKAVPSVNSGSVKNCLKDLGL